MSVTVQLSNDQYHNSWITLYFEITLVMASARRPTVHLVGHKNRFSIVVVLQKTSKFASTLRRASVNI